MPKFIYVLLGISMAVLLAEAVMLVIAIVNNRRKMSAPWAYPTFDFSTLVGLLCIVCPPLLLIFFEVFSSETNAQIIVLVNIFCISAIVCSMISSFLNQKADFLCAGLAPLILALVSDFTPLLVYLFTLTVSLIIGSIKLVLDKYRKKK